MRPYPTKLQQRRMWSRKERKEGRKTHVDEIMALQCGFYQDEVNKKNISTHSCTQDYDQIIITDDGQFFPRADDGSIIETLLSKKMPLPPVNLTTEDSLAGGSVSESDGGNFSQEESVSESCIDIEETLTIEVQSRPILWDHRLPITQRGKTTMAAQWEQVFKALKGQLSAAEAAKKWRNLKDCFMRYLNETKKSKASVAGATKRRKWRRYDLMLFYKDVQSVRSTTSNLGPTSPGDGKSQMKQKNLSNNSEVLLEKIATALQEPIVPPALPPLIMQPAINKPTDDVEHITEVIANAIRRLPEAEKMPFAMHLLNLAIEKEGSVRMGRVSRT